jgi:hypothetical protein
LILCAGGHILPGQSRERLFEFSFAGQMRRQTLDEVAISLEPRAVTAFGGQRKVFAMNHIAQLLQSLFRGHGTMLIPEHLFNKITGANSRPASPLNAGRQIGRASCAPPSLSAAVAQFWR